MLLLACAPPLETSSTGSVQQGIIGGTTDSGDPSVVLVVATKGKSEQAFCTGEVVSPHVVLSAAHCVDPDTLGSTGFTFQIFLGNNINDSTQQQTASNFVDVSETHFNSLFDPSQVDSGNDISVLITKTALPVPSLPMNRTALDPSMVGQNLRLVGYGINSGTDSQGSTAGTKRQTSSPLKMYDSLLINYGTSTHNTCEGDSGGPAFLTINGTEVIAGITSFGDKTCKQSGYDTRIDVFAASFVDPYIAANDPQGNSGTGSGTGSGSGNGANTGGAITAQNGTFGASCKVPSDCDSGLCYSGGGASYCTAACDLAHPSCPTDGTCYSVSGGSYCTLAAGARSLMNTDAGCSLAATPSQNQSGAVLVAGLMMLGLMIRSRRRLAKSRPRS